jgi:cell division protein FtsB
MSNDSANSRITAIWEKFAIGLLSVVMALGLLVIQDLRAQVKETESRVLFLYTDKVSNQQLKDTEQRLVTNIEGMRSDLLARLDLYFGSLNKRN